MKKIGLFAAGMLAAAVMSSSCNVLDLDATDRYSPATVWHSEETVDQYVIGFYSTFSALSDLNGNQGQFTDAYSDIIKSSSWSQYNHKYNYALLQASTFTNAGAGPFERWTIDYERIRRQNEFLRDAPEYRSKFGNTFIDQRIAEVRFCRAFTYMDLIRIYGGVVLRLEVDGPAQNNKPRSTEAACWDQVIADLRFAAENLPYEIKDGKPQNWNSDQFGRATRAAAWGLMSRAALYAKKWDVVIEAAEKAKEHGGQLITDGGPEKAYAEVFKNETLSSNKEVLFAVAYSSADYSHNHDAYFRPLGDKSLAPGVSLYAAFGPTSELVDNYEMSDGSAFEWNTHGSDPYADRDPRFYATILYNGASWEDRTIETYVGGADGIRDFEMQSAAGSTVTGYYLRKFLTEGDKGWKTAGSSHFMPICRYAEVLLNKAEALAEQDFGKNKTEAMAALKEVRERVGLTKTKDPADKEAFLDLLRHERMVELAGEGFRYWDIRRWRIGDKVINGQTAHGMMITKGTDGTLTYEQVEVDAGQTRFFFDRFYAFSIPTAERSNNPALGENNPGW